MGLFGSFNKESDAVREIDRLQKKAAKLSGEGKTDEAGKAHREAQDLHRQVWPHGQR